MNSEVDVMEKFQTILQSQDDAFEYNAAAIEQEYFKSGNDQSSLAIKILSIVGGFLSTLAFLGFLFSAGIFHSGQGLIIVGFILIGLSIWINHAFNKLILDTLSVSAYAMGYCMLAFGFSELHVDENTISGLFILIAFTSLFITQAFILSFISILIVNGSLYFQIINNQYFNLLHIQNAAILILLVYMFLNEARLITNGKRVSNLYNPVRIGLVFSLLTGLLLVAKGDILNFHFHYNWVLSVITIPACLYVISIITSIIEISSFKNRLLIYTVSLLILLPTIFVPAISASLLIILLSFRVDYKLGFSIGVIMFIYFVSQYYYDLNFTLLTKSILMFSSGILFLLLSALTYKKLDSHEKI